MAICFHSESPKAKISDRYKVVNLPKIELYNVKSDNIFYFLCKGTNFLLAFKL